MGVPRAGRQWQAVVGLLMVMALMGAACGSDGADTSAAEGGLDGGAVEPPGTPQATESQSEPTGDSGSDGSSAQGGGTSQGQSSVGSSSGSEGSGGQEQTATGSGGQQEGEAREARRASDRGVSEDQLLLGVLAQAENAFEAVGFAYDGKPHEEIIKPFIDEINDTGGINGRQVAFKVSRYNPLSQDSMQSACVEQAEDFEVFVSIAPIGFYGDAEICMAQKKTPLLTGNNSSRHTNHVREKGWVRQTMMDKNRTVKTWVDWLLAEGKITPTTRTGIVYSDVPEDRRLVNEVMIPYMESKNLQITEVSALGEESGGSAAESSVLRFKASDVQFVLPLPSFLDLARWLQAAESSDYHPEYSASDLSVLSLTRTTTNYPASQWGGVQAITSYRTGETPYGEKPRSKPFNDCEDAYSSYGSGLAKDPNDSSRPDDVEMLNMRFYCQHIALFREVASKAGINPTRPSYLDAFSEVNHWKNRVVDNFAESYGPEKYDGHDHYAVIEWKPSGDEACENADGGCYVQVRGFEESGW